MLVRGNKGFTLIELLIVIAIIVILAAVLIPNLLGARARAQITAMVAELRSISTGMETYSVDNGQYPANITDDFRNAYLGGKNPKLPWNETLILTAYSPILENQGYFIYWGIPLGLQAPARLLSGNANATGINLTYDKGVVFTP